MAKAPSGIHKGYVKTWSALKALHISSGCYGYKNSLGLESARIARSFVIHELHE